MEILYKISKIVSNQIAIIVLVVAAIGLLLPSSFTWMPKTSINWLLGIVMFGMGLTLKPHDFKVVFTKPKAVIIGCVAQFTIMPLLAWTLCKVFNLPTEIAIGVILVGCCPGGTASNVITYLAGGDIALSVGMTGVSTLAAPVMTPLLTFLLAGKDVDVDILAMLLSVLQVVILPIVLGFVANHYFEKFTQKMVGVLPLISTIAIALIVGLVMGLNAEKVLSSGLLIIAVVMLHNVLGLVLGFTIGKILKLDASKRNAIAIEVGMQNSGLATSLATIHFASYPLATIPGALFSVWHNFSGAITANILKHRSNHE